MLAATFTVLALAVGVIANDAAPPQPRTNAEAMARGMPPLDPRGGRGGWGWDHGHGHGNKPSGKPKPTQAGPDPDFSKTCDWYDIDFSWSNRPILRAKCKDNSGKKVFSQINLNNCLTNVNGKLKCAPGGFTGRSGRRDLAPGLEARHRPKQNKSKCTSCDVTGDDTIECSCPVNGGGRVDATYALGDCISNTNGKLTCKALD